MIVVFRNGGFLAQNERWFFGSSRLTAVSSYKYLGIVLTPRLSFQSTLNDLAVRARKGITGILRLLWSIGEHSPDVFFKLFDCQIQPILTYGAEIWGLTKNQDVIEKVHLSAMKRFMCLSQRTPKHLVYGELGRYPLHVNTYVKCIKFWLRIVFMDEQRYPKKAYNMLMSLQRQNYTTWACQIRNMLYYYGFGVVWEAQSVGNTKSFLVQFKQRLVDNFSQDWHSALESHSFYEVYSTFGQTLNMRTYFYDIKCIAVRKVFTRFRLGMLPLRAHYMNFNGDYNRNASCPFCADVPETEIHFLLACPKYNDLRFEFIARKYYRQPSKYKFALLLACPSRTVVMKLAVFIYKAYALRMSACDA